MCLADFFIDSWWEKFTNENENALLAGQLVTWGSFYVFCGRQSLDKTQARKLAATWKQQRKIQTKKHGLEFVVKEATQ